MEKWRYETNEKGKIEYKETNARVDRWRRWLMGNELHITWNSIKVERKTRFRLWFSLWGFKFSIYFIFAPTHHTDCWQFPTRCDNNTYFNATNIHIFSDYFFWIWFTPRFRVNRSPRLVPTSYFYTIHTIRIHNLTMIFDFVEINFSDKNLLKLYFQSMNNKWWRLRMSYQINCSQ